VSVFLWFRRKILHGKSGGDGEHGKLRMEKGEAVILAEMLLLKHGNFGSCV